MHARKKVFIILIPIIAIFIIFVTLQISSNSDNNTSPTVIYNEDGTTTLPLNAIGYAVRNTETMHTYDAGHVIKPINDVVDVVFEFNQNMANPKDYTLIILVNCIQHEFWVDEYNYTSYPFNVSEKGSILLDIQLKTNPETDREIMFLVFEQPDYCNSVVKDDDDIHYINDISLYVATMRYPLYDDLLNKPSYNVIQNLQKAELDIEHSGLFLTRDYNPMILLPVVKSGEKVLLIIGNPFEYASIFAIGSLLGWEQSILNEDEMIEYLHVP